MLLGYLTPRDGDERGNARLGSQQIIEVVIQLTRINVKTDVENTPLRMIQEAEVHLAQICFGLLGNADIACLEHTAGCPRLSQRGVERV